MTNFRLQALLVEDEAHAAHCDSIAVPCCGRDPELEQIMSFAYGNFDIISGHFHAFASSTPPHARRWNMID